MYFNLIVILPSLSVSFVNVIIGHHSLDDNTSIIPVVFSSIFSQQKLMIQVSSFSCLYSLFLFSCDACPLRLLLYSQVELNNFLLLLKTCKRMERRILFKADRFWELFIGCTRSTRRRTRQYEKDRENNMKEKQHVIKVYDEKNIMKMKGKKET